jgi:hypothetical protein
MNSSPLERKYPVAERSLRYRLAAAGTLISGAVLISIIAHTFSLVPSQDDDVREAASLVHVFLLSGVVFMVSAVIFLIECLKREKAQPPTKTVPPPQSS